MAEYPTLLTGDPGAPAVLFALGDPGVLEAKSRVAIVGTRSATHYGRQVASELARDLAAEGIVVVSGLARGIDGAAHAGALRAGGDESVPPVAVVGTGLDVVYPASNRDLWAQVAEKGAVLSEAALGTQPHPGVFPARNRIIAALSDVVVVVESHRGGGSLYTAEAAARRSIPVCAVPGSVRSRASDGTNALLVDGCTPVRDATDVLVAVSLATAGTEGFDLDAQPPGTNGTGRSSRTVQTTPTTRTTQTASRPKAGIDRTPTGPGTAGAGVTKRPGSGPPGTAGAGVTKRPGSGPALSDPGPTPQPLDPTQGAVLDAIDDVPTRFETILIRTGLSIATAAEACEGLVEQGLVIAGAGWWSQSRDL